MSLRRRIAGAAALAVAAVAVTMGAIGYVSTRSHLVSELRGELRERAAPFLRPHGNGFGTPGAEHGARTAPATARRIRARADGGPHHVPIPPAPRFGGAPGYFQLVYPDGTTEAQGGGAHSR